MKCYTCGHETNDKRRKKCPICGTRFSSQKMNGFLFQWSDCDYEKLSDVKNTLQSTKNETLIDAKPDRNVKAKENTDVKPATSSKTSPKNTTSTKGNTEQRAQLSNDNNVKRNNAEVIILLVIGMGIIFYLGLAVGTYSISVGAVLLAISLFLIGRAEVKYKKRITIDSGTSIKSEKEF